MKLSDCPHRVGTPEHSAWIRSMYIPAEAHRGRYAEDALRYGADAIGRRLVRGQRITHTFTVDVSRFQQAMVDMQDAMAQVVAVTGSSVQDVPSWIEAMESSPNPTLRIIASHRRRRNR